MSILRTRFPSEAKPNVPPESGAADCAGRSDHIDWLGAQEDVVRLRVSLVHAPDYVYEPMTVFALEAGMAAEQTDLGRMRAAAKEIGRIGLNYLREASATTLAELTAEALAA